MIKGLYTSVSGLHAADLRQQVLAGNIANVNTAGFKSDDVTTENFEKVFNELFNPNMPGTGAISTGRRFDLGQGALTQTGGALDAAIDGDGFFALSNPDGTTLYTRSGRFNRDASGVLRSPDGLAVLGANGQPITATGNDVKILTDGTVTSDGAPVGRIRIDSLDPTTLQRAGTATFTSTGTPILSTAKVVSGALENSNVDVTATMTSMTLLLRAFEAGKQALQLQNDTLNQTVNQVGQLR